MARGSPCSLASPSPSHHRGDEHVTNVRVELLGDVASRDPHGDRVATRDRATTKASQALAMEEVEEPVMEKPPAQSDDAALVSAVGADGAMGAAVRRSWPLRA